MLVKLNGGLTEQTDIQLRSAVMREAMTFTEQTRKFKLDVERETVDLMHRRAVVIHKCVHCKKGHMLRL